MQQKPRANHQQLPARSLLHDHKNKLAQPPSFKPQTLKGYNTRGNTHRTCSPHLECLANFTERSPKSLPTQPNSTCLHPFSKSQEETKAQEQYLFESSSCKEEGWGVLSEYKEEIMSYVLKRESLFKIDGSYLHHSPILNSKMRIYFIRHIFKIYNRFGLLRTTLHLAVNYLDLYFSKEVILTSQLEGIAAAQACLFIAMKYEEIYPPDLRDWVDRKRRQEVLKMQAKILATLNFQLAHYTVENYLRMEMWEKGEEDEGDESQLQLLTDLTLFDINIRQLPGSQLASAIRSLTRRETPPDHKTALSVRWMVQRNAQSLFWLRQQKYGDPDCENLF